MRHDHLVRFERDLRQCYGRASHFYNFILGSGERAHIIIAAEAVRLRGNGDECTLATAANEVVGVGGPPITIPKLALEAHEMVVAHAWDSQGGLAVASRRRVLYHNQTYKPVGEVKDLAFDARDRLRLGTFAGVENVEDETIGWPGRCCVCIATLDEDVFAAALDGELALLKSARDLAWTAPLPADRAQCIAAADDVVVVSTRLGSLVAFNHSGSERWSQKVGDGDDGGGTYTIIYDGVCYAAGGGAWAAYSLDTGAPLVHGILKPRRCRGLGVGAVFGDTAGGRASPLLSPPPRCFARPSPRDNHSRLLTRDCVCRGQSGGAD